VTFCGEEQGRTIASQEDEACTKVVTTIDFPTLLEENQVPEYINFMSLDVEGCVSVKTCAKA
jgi:hypothetical protein